MAEATTSGGEVLHDASPIKDESMDILYKSYGEITAPESMGPADRSGAFKDLLGVCKTGSTKAKMFAAEKVPEFMPKFPALFNEALEAQMDLCEDENADVRMQACRNLPRLCAHDVANAGAIADVLAQLMKAPSPAELAVAREGLVTVVKANVGSCVTALAKHCVGEDVEEETRAKVIEFLTAKDVSRLIGQLSNKDDSTEREVVTALKSIITVPVTPEEFRNVFGIVRGLRMFKKAENLHELVEIASAQAGLGDDAGASIDVTSADALGKVALCFRSVMGSFYRGADAGPFLRFVSERVLPVYDTVPSENGVAVLKMFAELSKLAANELAAAALPVVYSQLVKELGAVEAAKAAEKAAEAARKAADLEKQAEKLKAQAAELAAAAAAGAGEEAAEKPAEAAASGDGEEKAEEPASAPEAPSGATLKFTEIEALLFTFHQLASKVPRALPSLCGLFLKPKVFTGQPGDLMAASDLNTAEATKFKGLLTALVESNKQYIAQVRAGMKALPRAAADASAEEKKAHAEKTRKVRDKAMGAVRCLTNANAMCVVLARDDLELLGGDKSHISWRRPQGGAAGKGGKQQQGKGKGGVKGGAGGAGGAGGPKAKKRKADGGAGSAKKAKGQQQPKQQQQQQQGKKKKGGAGGAGGQQQGKKQQQQQQQGKKKKGGAAGGAGGAGGRQQQGKKQQQKGGGGGGGGGQQKAKAQKRGRGGGGGGGGQQQQRQQQQGGKKKGGGGGGGGNGGNGGRKRGRGGN